MTTQQIPKQSDTTLDSVVIRFCGDSGDGMHLTGGRFTDTAALLGNDFATFPDFPAEIRAPKGTTFGVSGFQVHFSSDTIFTPGDRVNAMVAMNPAGLKMNLPDVEPGGIVIVNEDEFTKGNLTKCGYREGYNPLDDEEINAKYNLIKVPMSRLTKESLADSGMGAKDINRCRNMFALGIVYWLYDRPIDLTKGYLNKVFGEKKGKPEIAKINIRALEAGYYFGETSEAFPSRYRVPPAKQEPGTYRQISGNEGTVLGLVAAAQLAKKEMVYASYPITPASNVIHGLARLKRFGIKTIQSEDEIAVVCSAIGASFAGNIGVTGTSGPGLALKGEALGLAMMLELPLIVVNVQRAGPSTGMPTKTEQADLLQAMYGRHCESPVIVVAPRSPSDCFNMAIEAVRLSIEYMCPVIYLSDGYIGNGAEPWKVPDISTFPPINVVHPTLADIGDEGFLPYKRNAETLARKWAIPGIPGLEHRVGGLEKEENTGNISYDAENHQKMVDLRAEKVERAAQSIPPLKIHGEPTGDVLVLGWGGTYGSITTAVDQVRANGHSVSSAHLQYLNPFPSNLEEVLRSFKKVVLPEINSGQLSMILRAKFLIDIIGINIIKGQPFRVDTLVERITE
ncbi:MAG: 2-oxoacid:acceptor oxidoreductase subunit alpha, partial [Phycisphaerales bacterium]|nr:2-oxoacid:acceptor oxidoreductase subunit alpha [Phycisphaerales bacterium]